MTNQTRRNGGGGDKLPGEPYPGPHQPPTAGGGNGAGRGTSGSA
ncbi:hypothetical protein [Streptomyces sp. SS8]